MCARAPSCTCTTNDRRERRTSCVRVPLLPPIDLMQSTAVPTTPVTAIDLGLPVSALAACPNNENLVLAAGADHLTLLATDDDGTLQRLSTQLIHKGALDAIAWGTDAEELRVAAVGARVVTMHRVVASEGACERLALALPSGGTRSCCFLQPTADRLVVTGDDCRCHIVQVAHAGASAGAGPAPAAVERTLALGSPGVVVRTHSREPSQLMIAEEDGKIHFIDLRAPAGARPSLSRDLPAGEADAGGLRDADWSAFDPYLVGGVCGKRWVVWDLRQPGLAPPPHTGDAQPSGALCFRWHPSSASFATAAATGEHTRAHVQLHELQPADNAPATGAASGWAAVVGAAAAAPRLFAHDLPTRVAALAWLPATAPLLLGACDTKVCLWSVGGNVPPVAAIM